MPTPILLASDVSARGGAMRALALLARALPPERFAVTVAVPDARALDDDTAALEAAGIPVERLRHAPGHSATGVREFQTLLAGLSPALCHVHLPHSGSARTLLLAARRSGVPVVTTEHDPFPLALPKKLVKRLTLSWTARTIAISDWCRELLLQEYGLPLDRVVRVWNGIDADSVRGGTPLPELRSACTLLTISALHPRKGLTTLLQALPDIRAQVPGARLLVLGEGPQRAELESLATRMGIAEHVRFLEFRTDVADVLASCDLLVQPSTREAFGLAVVEAMAAGKPVVATEVGGHVDTIVDGETGLLVPPNDPAAMAAAVARLAADAGLRARMGAAGAARVEAEFTAARMAERTAAVYDAVLA